LRELTADLGVGDRVLFLGQLDARTAYAAFDVLAICSRKEGLPYVVLEAMAAGLPVAATASAGIELLVEQGVNGEIVGRDDVEAFSEALRRLLSNPALRSRYAGAARERAARFTVSGMVDGTLTVYLDAIGTRTTTAPAGDTDRDNAEVNPAGALEVIA
jgi:glycosyltransferase involved in cell wall biosynthesis